MQNEGNMSASDKINDFVQKNRKGILVLLGLVVVLVVGLITFLTLQDVFYKKAIIEINELDDRYNELRFYIGNEEHAGEVETLFDDLNKFAENTKVFPEAKHGQ